MTKATMSRKMSKIPSAQKIHDLLLSARGADWVHLHFKDGRTLFGSIIFNEFKGTGRLINIEKEVSVDFHIDHLRDVRF